MKIPRSVAVGCALFCVCSAALMATCAHQTMTILVVFEGADEVFMNGEKVPGDSVTSIGYWPKRFEARWGKTVRRFVLRPRFTDDNSTVITVREEGPPELHGFDVDFREVSRF